jgi:phage baseplate assembly protein W
MAEFDTPHFKSPFRIRGATAQYVEQGSLDEIVQNCVVILRTPYGSREGEPNFGFIQQEFEDTPTITVQDIEAALMRDEPRARHLDQATLKELALKVQVQLTTNQGGSSA